MPHLCFPTADVLRLAIRSGIVPASVAARPARGHGNGPVWIDPEGPVAREVVATLAKLGVSEKPAPGELRAVLSWAELVPVVPTGQSHAGRFLWELPHELVPRAWHVAGRLGVRLSCPEGGWLLSAALTPTVVTLAESWGTLYPERSPGVWVRAGFDHPLADLLAAADRGVVIAPDAPWRPAPIERRPVSVGAGFARVANAPARMPRFTGRVRLVRAGGAVDATLWAVPEPEMEAARDWLGSVSDDELAMLRVARVRRDSAAWLLIAGPRGAIERPPFAGGVGYARHPRLARLLLPVGTSLAPPLRPDRLSALFEIHPQRFGLLRAEGGRVVCDHVPVPLFQPARLIVRYTRPAARVVREVTSDHGRFALPRFVVAQEPVPAPPVLPPPGPPTPRRARSSVSWINRWFSAKNVPRPVPEPVAVKEPIPERVLEKLQHPQALTLGGEWVARRAGVERRVLAEFPRAGSVRRRQLWCELAEVYQATGNLADAGLCWLNAAWGQPDLPVVRAWHEAERRLARLSASEPFDLAPALALPRPAAGRYAASLLSWAAATPTPPPEVVGRLRELAEVLTQSLPDVPVRAAWLGFRSVDVLSRNDVLGLARCRDRLFDRLTRHGFRLDVDAPAFLRFGGSSGERHAAARDWTARMREPMHRWLGRLATPGRLQWAGLDGDPTGTTAYADLMLAWGCAKLGDRARCGELESQARAALSAATPPGADPRVPRLLSGLYRTRCRLAADGQPDAPGIPREFQAAYAELDELGRYAVDKLRAGSAILEPGELVDPYGGRGVATFLGTDALGERLARFLAGREFLPRAADAWELLALGPSDAPAATMPRVVFALLEAAPRLDVELVAALLPQTIRAVELIPEWVRLSSPYTDAHAVAHRVGRRMVESACHAAGFFHLPESFAAMTEEFIRHTHQADGPGRLLAESVAGLYFRTLRRLNLKPLAAILLERFPRSAVVTPRDLGLAAGHFSTGQDEAGNRILDAARDRLLVRGLSDPHERTAVAIAYATALGDAPPRIALGRLEELFQRLEMLSTEGTANRYYTLHPLRLIDAVVRSAIGDDMTVPPGVRQWLAGEEFLTRAGVSADLTSSLADWGGRVQ